MDHIPKSHMKENPYEGASLILSGKKVRLPWEFEDYKPPVINTKYKIAH